jgi:hypothetical protein
MDNFNDGHVLLGVFMAFCNSSAVWDADEMSILSAKFARRDRFTADELLAPFYIRFATP